MLHEKQSYNQVFTEIVTLRLVGRVMINGLALLPWVVAEVPEGYRNCQGFCLRSMGSQLQVGLPSSEYQSQEKVPT